jgi:hypothetical protein
VKSKRRRLQEIADKLTKEANDSADAAEKEKDWALLSKSNALRMKVVEHLNQIKEIDRQLHDLTQSPF